NSLDHSSQEGHRRNEGERTKDPDFERSNISAVDRAAVILNFSCFFAHSIFIL
ncbi:hypothetical protein X975_12629, partial [Stegodyphus mimosarum]